MKRYNKIITLTSTESGEYNWTLGDIAFGNPLDIPEAVREKKRKAKEAWQAKERVPGDLNRKRDYRQKFG